MITFSHHGMFLKQKKIILYLRYHTGIYLTASISSPGHNMLKGLEDEAFYGTNLLGTNVTWINIYIVLQSYVKFLHFKRINTSDKTPLFMLPLVA